MSAWKLSADLISQSRSCADYYQR